MAAAAGAFGAEVFADLRAEGDALEELVTGLDDAEWARPTPAPGWTVAHQIAHLAWTDARALLAAEDPAAFRREAEAALASPGTFVDEGAQEGAALPPGALLERWSTGRARLAGVLERLAARPGPEKPRLPWYGPPMSPAAMATGRLMETWAHGEDVAEAFGARRAPTARLRHVARIGVRARDFAYAVHGLQPPAEPFRVELAPPGGGAPWTYGPEDAPQRVTGEGLDFCLLVTQRLHRDDAHVAAEGAEAERWLGIAQAFAGPPGQGRAPKSRTPMGRTPKAGPGEAGPEQGGPEEGGAA